MKPKQDFLAAGNYLFCFMQWQYFYSCYIDKFVEKKLFYCETFLLLFYSIYMKVFLWI